MLLSPKLWVRLWAACCCCRQATVQDLPAIQITNLMCLPENYNLRCVWGGAAAAAAVGHQPGACSDSVPSGLRAALPGS